MTLKAAKYPWLAALRVYQWSKNLLVFAALLFGGQLLIFEQVMRSVAAFAVFCAASSGIYLFNDLVDVERDRDHPVKRLRPYAAGVLRPERVRVVCAVLLVGACGAAFALRMELGVVVLLYAVLMMAYSLVLKRILLLDVLTVSTGFVMRAVAGAVVLGVVFTNWLVVCTFFLALFLGLAKRRRELNLLNDRASLHREVHALYSESFLDGLMLLAAGAALVAYMSYACSETVVERFGTDKLYLTIPFVVYGLFRYLFLVHHSHGGEDPSRTLLQDRPLIATVALWSIACALVIYGRAAKGA
jgi:4-hydroxybenzoate polyprenyltransferase